MLDPISDTNILAPPDNQETNGTVPSNTSKDQRFPRRAWLAALAAILVAGLLLGVLLRRPLSSTPAQQSGSNGTSSGAAIAIAPLPVLSQSTLYISSGTLHALQASTGTLIRNYPMAGTPAIVDGIMYVGTLDDVYALRVADGSILWHDQIGNRTLLPPVVANGIVYVLPNGTTLDALRASDGKLLWQYNGSQEGEEVTLPVVANGTACIGASNSNGAFVVALNTANGLPIWRHQVGTTYVNLSMENNVIYISSSATLTALRAGDGSILWQQHMSSQLGSVTVSGGVVYGIANDGHLYARRASDGGAVWSFSIGKEASSITAPVVVDGLVYIAALSSSGTVGGNYGYMYALRAGDGHLIWQFKLRQNVIPNFTVGKGLVYLASRDGLLYALQASTGRVIWTTSIR
jgi:outer membrane protein assembly factor BamB